VHCPVLPPEHQHVTVLGLSNSDWACCCCCCCCCSIAIVLAAELPGRLLGSILHKRSGGRLDSWVICK
jgi:hypothetical protein